MSQQAVLRNVDARGVATVTHPGLRAVVLRGARAIVRAACRQAPQRRGDGGARVVR